MPKVQLKAGNHTCLGVFEPLEAPLAEIPNSIDRPCLIVYAGEFQSMNGPVEITEGHLDLICAQHNSRLSKMKRLVTGEVPAKAQPPVQLDHSVSAVHTVGRLVGEVSKGMHVLESGAQVPALFGTVRVLGRENVEKVLDGRWTHLSGGLDLETGKINELTITPFPAAAEAAMLAKKVTAQYVWDTCEAVDDLSIEAADAVDAYKKAVAYYKDYPSSDLKEAINALASRLGTTKLSEGKEPEMHEKLKKHLMESAKMSAEEAEAKLSGMTDDEKTKLSAEADEASAKLAGEKAEEKAELTEEKKEEEQLSSEKTEETDAAKAQLSAAPAGVQLSADNKAKLVQLMSDFRKAGSGAQLKAKEAQLQVRLSSLKASAKITPAEIKKMDIVKLSAASQETIDAVFKSYEDREPVIIPGILGTAKAMNIAQLSADIQKQTLENETLENMPSLKKAMLSGKPQAGKKIMTAGKSPALEAGSEVDPDFTTVCALMDGGKVAEAKEALKKVMVKLSAGGYAGMTGIPQESQQQISTLADSVKSMQNQFDEIMKLVGPILGV